MHLNRSPTGVPPVQGREGEREKFPFGVFVLVTTAGRPALVRPDGWAAGAGEADGWAAGPGEPDGWAAGAGEARRLRSRRR